MADQIEEGEIADVMVKDSGKERDRSSRSKSSSHSRSRDSDRRMSKEDTRSSDTSRKSGHRSDASRASSSSVAKDHSGADSGTKGSAGDQLTGTSERIIMPDKKELYDAVTTYESQLAASTDVSSDEKEFLMTCGAFEDVMKDIEDLKAGGKYDEEELEELKMEGLLLLGKIRQLNRLSKLRLKAVKDETMSCRQEVDRDHLLLQNLMYEAQNLKKQVEAVQSYKGQDEEIDLIPVEKFYQEAPVEISKPDVTKFNDHFLRIARLEYEFVLRQNLTNECANLEKEKDKAAVNIDTTKKKLDSLQPLLSAVLDSTKPVQDFFGMSLCKDQREYKTAHLLPGPLYVLFVESSAYKSALHLREGDFSVRICGDVDAAKEFVDNEISEEQDYESDSDMDVDENDNADADEQHLDRRKSRKGRKGSKTVAKKLNMKKQLLQIHPLSVEWSLRIPGGECLVLSFYFATKLKIVTVKSKIEGGVLSQKLPPMLHQEDSILTNLFPDDSGTESPNPVTPYLLQRADVSGFSELASELGRPYVWAQKAAGVNFPVLMNEEEAFSAAQRADPTCKLSKRHIQIVVHKLLERLRNQATLWKQIHAIESRNLAIPVNVREKFPPKISSNFVSWEAMSLNGSSHVHDVVRFLLKSKKLDVDTTSKDMLFRVIVERGRVRLSAFILIGLNFPAVPPIFMLLLERDGNESDWTTDAALKEVEAEINCFAPEEFHDRPDVLLALQIQRMMCCLDILLETENMLGEATGPSEFGRDKLFTNPTRGRNLRRPFEYKPGGTFSQRF